MNPEEKEVKQQLEVLKEAIRALFVHLRLKRKRGLTITQEERRQLETMIEQAERLALTQHPTHHPKQYTQ